MRANEGRWPHQRGGMARRIRGFDWSTTPLGPIRTWPAHLRTAVDLMLDSPLPGLLWCGPGLTQLYNEAAVPLVEAGGPAALGASAADAWHDAWGSLGPLVDRVVGAGEAVLGTDVPAPAGQGGGRRLALACSPLRDAAGAVTGVSLAILPPYGAMPHRDTAVEEALRASEERLQIALAAGRMGTWRFDLRTGAQEWSPRQYEIFGLDPAVAPTRDLFLGRVHRDDRHLIEFGPDDLRPGAGILDSEFRIVRQDGEIRWVTAHTIVRHDGDGTPIEMVGVNWDVTERRRSEQALRASERELRIALEAGRMGTYQFDVRTGIERWSDAEYEMLGLERTGEPPTRELFLSIVHPDDLPRVEFGPEDQRPEGTPLDSEFRIIRPDTGEVRWLTAHALAVFGPDGRPAELIGVNQDVTEQKRAQEALRSSEERLREFGEASADVLWIRSADDLQWEYLSPGFDRIYGITRQDALRGDNLRSWLDLIVPEDRAHALANIEKVRAGKHARFEYRIRRPNDGAIRWLRDTDFPILDASGRVARIGGIGADFTELKLAQQHQNLLLAELQHRVRNTLAVIRSIVKRTLATSATAEEYAIHLQGRIDAFARSQAIATRDPAGGVDLATIVAEELAAAAAREGERFSLSGPELRLNSKAAETLALAIHELATNAIKYGSLAATAGRVEVDWKLRPGTDGQWLHLTWRESGLDGPLSPPKHRGFGMEILEKTLAYDLRGRTTITFDADGLRCEIELPARAALAELAEA